MNTCLMNTHNVNPVNQRIPKVQPDEELIEAIENIKSTLRIQVTKGNPDAEFILRRMR